MRIALTLLFLISISYSMLLKLGIVAYYEYNRIYIAQNLCENRDKPALKCCGKCYLRKQLAKADRGRSTGQPLLAQLSKFEVAPFIIPEAFLLSSIPGREASAESYYHAPFPKEVMRAIFHPPG